MRLVILILLFLFFNIVSVLCQSQLIDSLYVELENQTDDNAKVDILIKLSGAKQQTDIEEAIRLAKKALKLANYIGNDTLTIRSYYYMHKPLIFYYFPFPVSLCF